ncbi:MAG TPA: mechanosensitive ion channel domain-containing protein [Alphaproteobacteria bacterium]|nr:mechanosensitive ion channel domain-containing protein [Alphaproteobacteria bacterium]
MKHFLLAVYSLLLIKSGALATKFPMIMPQSEAPAGPPIKPIKVSELNANIFAAVFDFFKATGGVVFEGFVSLKDFVETGEWLVLAFQTPATRDLLGSFGVRLIISLLLALAISQGMSSWLTPKINKLLLSKTHPTPQKQKKLILAALLSMASPLTFGFFLYTIFRLLNPHDGIYLEVVRILSSGAVTIWIILNLAHVFLKPLTPEHQHIPLSQEVLATTYVWIRRMGVVALFGFFALEAGALIRLPVAGERLLLQGSGFIIALLAIFMMLALHEEVSDWIRKQRAYSRLSPLKKALLPFLEYSYIPVIVFIVISYVSWVTHEFDRFQVVVWKSLFTLAIFPFIRIAAYWLRKLRILCIQKKLQRWSRTYAQRAIFYGQQIDFVILILLNTAAFFFVLDLWGFNPSHFIFSATGRLIAEKAFSIFMILVVSLVITRLGNDLLTRYLSKEKGLVDEVQKQRAARFKTISSVSRNVLRIAVWTPAILFIVVELDVDVVPILATVTVIGFGLSFGVQALVKDFVTGFFMLLEDAFAVGDLMVINGQMGRIESLTVRVVRLRATDGSLYTFPYGNITSLCNQNRDYSAALMLFRVGVDADINQVYEALEKISSDLQKDKKTRSLVVGPLEIDGINELNDHSIEIRAVLKTKPGQHYKVKWAFNRLLKQYLESYNIPAALPRQISYNYAFEK